jgi:hypothetical protein
MYSEEDVVYVWNEGALKGQMTILESDDEEENFQVRAEEAGVDGEILTLPRKQVMYDWETDKLGVLFFEANLIELEKNTDNDDIAAFETQAESDEDGTVMSDASLEGLLMNVTSSFSDVPAFDTWLQQSFGVHSPNGIYHSAESGVYYLVLIG